MSDSVRPYGLYPIRLLCPWDSPGKNTNMSCHALLQTIFLTQGSNLRLLRLLRWQVGSLPLASFPWADSTFKKALTLPTHSPESWIPCTGASVHPRPSLALPQAERKGKKCSPSRRGLCLKLAGEANPESHHLKPLVLERPISSLS